MRSLLIVIMVLQMGVIAYKLSLPPVVEVVKQEVAIQEEDDDASAPESEEQVQEGENEENIEVVAKETDKGLNYFIPRRRVISGEGIELDKDINALGALGEVMLENPLMVRGIEKLVRDQFFAFYGEFIEEADLTPYEQAEMFKLMSQGMQENLKSLMAAIGENMGEMRGMFRNGPPPALLLGVKENNLSLKEDMIAGLGQEKFSLFEQYHREKSAAEEYMRIENSLKRGDQELADDQKDSLRQLLLDEQKSPFEEDTYEERINTQTTLDKTSTLLSESQQKVLKKNRKRHNRIYLLPF